MALNLDACWGKPLPLVRAEWPRIYHCPDLSKVPPEEGVYVFGRRFGTAYIPCYIGQSVDLHRRLWEHLNLNNKLMSGLRSAPNGHRFVIFCTIDFRQGQNHKDALDVLENALIEHALAEGYELLNVKGTRLPSHTVAFSGNRISESIAPRLIRLRA